MRPPQGDSPRQTRKAPRSENLRQRQERNADEIIRFVRELQFEAQPHALHFHKKAPLPGIGHSSVKNVTNDSGFLDRAVDLTDSDSDSTDCEIVRAQQRKSSRPIDPYFMEILTCPRGTTHASTDHLVLSRSLSHAPQDFYNNNVQRPLKQASFIKHAPKHHRTTGKQLPPLSRDVVPERPSAPSPSRTPPTSDHSFIEDEPVEYLDLS